MYKYHIENGTNMELWYECECGGDRFSGIIMPTSDVQRQIHGINHSMTVVASGAELRCVLKSTADMRQAGEAAAPVRQLDKSHHCAVSRTVRRGVQSGGDDGVR